MDPFKTLIASEKSPERGSRRSALDSIDLNMMRILENDARITKHELADRVGVTPAPCSRRLRRLESQGYIRGYHAKLDSKLGGFAVSTFVLVGLESQGLTEVRAFETLIAKWSTVRECYATSGATDFLLNCVASNLTEFQLFVRDALVRTQNVRTVKSYLVIRTSKDDARLLTTDHRGSSVTTVHTS